MTPSSKAQPRAPRAAGASLLPLSLLVSGFACVASTSPTEAARTQGAAITGAHGESCDRSRYNCKVPNFESTPSSVARDTNRVFDSFDGSYFWGVNGEPELRDGDSNLRGYVAGDEGHAHAVKLDFGERKTLGGAPHVYAFSALLTDGQSASGWIPESAIVRQNTLAKMPTVAPADPGTPYYSTDWVVTGGDLALDHASLAMNVQYGDRRVDPDATSGEHASDYLVREWDAKSRSGFINLLYNLPGVGGVSDDTLPMCVHFRRFTGVDQLATKLYFTGSPYESKLSLHFVYGSIGGRRGWIAHEVLTASTDLGKLDSSHPCYVAPTTPPPSRSPPPSTSCGVLCCQSCPGAGAFSESSSAACIADAQTYCDAYGHVQSATAGGSRVYQRDGSTDALRCWAKCKGRVEYHEVVGVTTDCNGESQSYCAVGDRGGLEDALWNRCDPNG